MRAIFTIIHRWFGLVIAAFIFVTGLTGAIIAWDHELDALLNPHLMRVSSRCPALPAVELVRKVEARDPQIRITYLPLLVEPGKPLALFGVPRTDPETKRPYVLNYNQIFLDPVTGAELGRREWGRMWPVSSENLIPFLYKLHYTLHIPKIWGTDKWGVWLLGAIAIIWAFDCFVGFYLTLPLRRQARAARTASVQRQLDKSWWTRWKPAWMVKWSGSAYRINFDIHRAFSLWTWLLLFMLAFTSIYLNLYSEIFRPVLSAVSRLTPTPFDTRKPFPATAQIEPVLDYQQIKGLAEAEAARRGWNTPVGAISYAPRFGFYSPRFYEAGDDHSNAGVGPARIYIDGMTGEVLGARIPWQGTAADIFMQAQFPLHSGRILGLPGRILISIMGIVCAVLSVTGVVIWYRKRVSRQRKAVLAGRLAKQPAE